MPTYQYACTACGHGFEVVQAFTDNALTECPECQGRLRKVFGSVGVVFKGSGFYRTDSREKPKSETAGKGDGKGDKTDAAAKGDAKPAKSEGASGGTSGTSGGSSSVNGSSGSATTKTPSTAGSAA